MAGLPLRRSGGIGLATQLHAPLTLDPTVEPSALARKMMLENCSTLDSWPVTHHGRRNALARQAGQVATSAAGHQAFCARMAALTLLQRR